MKPFSAGAVGFLSKHRNLAENEEGTCGEQMRKKKARRLWEQSRQNMSCE
jgi:hypothetical protein